MVVCNFVTLLINEESFYLFSNDFICGYVLQGVSNDLMQQAQVFSYANGNDHPPTSFDLDKSMLRDLLFNQSPTKVSSHKHDF